MSKKATTGTSERRNRSGFAGLSIALLAVQGAAAPWDIELVVEGGAVYSDNIFLADDGLEESEAVYRLAPEIEVSTEGERIEADIAYKPEALFYENTSDANDIYHVLDGVFQAALIPRTLFVDLSAVNYQVVEVPESRFPSNNVPISGSRVDSTSWSVGPRLQREFGRTRLFADVTYRKTSFDNVLNLDNDLRSGSLRLDNHEREEGVSWALDYEYRRLEYERDVAPFEFQRASAELGYWVSGSLRLFVGGGAETPFDEVLEGDLDDDFWEAGFAYHPSDRMSLEAAAGERGYGTSLRGRMMYRSRRMETELIYIEHPTTQVAVVGENRPTLRTDNLDDFLLRLNQDTQFIRKRAQWKTTFTLPKTTIILRLFNERRTDAFSSMGVPRPEESFSGGAFRFDWEAGARVTLGANTDLATRDDGTREEDLRRYGLSAAYRLSPRLDLIGRAQRAEEDSADPSLGNYTEDQYHLMLRMVLR